MREFTQKSEWGGVVLGACLAALLAAPGCGGGDEDEPACGVKGCVDLLNFSSIPAVIGIQGVTGTATVPAATLQNQALMPGTSWAQVSSSMGNQTQFNLIEGGSVVRSVTCTVGPDAWLDPLINPALVVQTNRTLTCSGW
jgi:hypothetical protein